MAFVPVATGKLRRASSPIKMLSRANLRDAGRIPLGVLQARRIVADFQPDVVLATGGYVAVPIGLAASWCRRPLVIHEQTVRVGLANRLLARQAAAVAVSSESTLPLLPAKVRARAVVTGNPVRPEVLDGHADKAIDALGLDGFDRARPTVYITGGAQGAVQINDLVDEILPWLLRQANVIHQVGAPNLERVRSRARHLDQEQQGRYWPTAFIGPELPDVLALTDVVISRSGAGTIAELTALGKASVLIPLASSAGNEQMHNARHLQEAGAAVALLDGATAERLRAALEPLLGDGEQRSTIAARAATVGRPDAAERLADLVLSVAGR